MALQGAIQAEILKKILEGDLTDVRIEELNEYISILQNALGRLRLDATSKENAHNKPPAPPPMKAPAKAEKSTTSVSKPDATPVVSTNHDKALFEKLSAVKKSLLCEGEPQMPSALLSSVMFRRELVTKQLEFERAHRKQQFANERSNPDALAPMMITNDFLREVHTHKKVLNHVEPKASPSPEQLARERLEYEKLKAALEIEDIIEDFYKIETESASSPNPKPCRPK